MAHSKTISGWLKEASWHSLVYGVGAVLQVALSFLLLPLYTSQWTPPEFAIFNLAVTTASLAGAIFYLGGYSSLSRFYFDHEGEARRGQAASTAVTLTLVGATLQMLAVMLAARPLAAAILGEPAYATVLVAAFAASALTFVNQIFLLVLRLHRRSTAVVVANLAALLATAASILWLVLVRHWGVMGALIGSVIGQAAITPWLVWLCRPVLGRGVSRADVRQQLAYGLPSVVISFGYYALDQSDRMVLKHLASLNAVAVYSAGYSVGRVVQALFVQPFAQIWNPMRLEYRNHPESPRLSALVLTYYAMAGLTLVVGLSLFSREIIAIATSKSTYAGASRVLPLVLLSHLAYGSVNIIDTGILVNNRLWQYMVLLLTALALNVALNFWWVPSFGYMGSAWATLASYLAFVGMTFVVSNRLMPVAVEAKRLLTVVGSAVGTMAVKAMGPAGGIQAVAWQLFLFVALLAFWLTAVLDARERDWLRGGPRRLMGLFSRPDA